jgi:hypothetical protein
VGGGETTCSTVSRIYLKRLVLLLMQLSHIELDRLTGLCVCFRQPESVQAVFSHGGAIPGVEGE